MSSQSIDHNNRIIVECTTDYIVIYVPCIALTQYNNTITFHISPPTLSLPLQHLQVVYNAFFFNSFFFLLSFLPFFYLHYFKLAEG